MRYCLSRFWTILLCLLKITLVVVLVIAVLGLIAWKVLDARCLHTHQFAGKGGSLANEQQFIIHHNLALTITNLAQPKGGERNVYRPENLTRAASWISQRFAEYGYSATNLGFPVPGHYKFDATSFSTFATNIVATKTGTSNAEEIIVIGAHYDTIGFSKQWTGDDTNYFRLNHPGTPGANDNASGVAALLEIARLLTNTTLPRTVRFVAFANEEPPFFEEKDAMGSYLYAQQCRARGERIIAMISLDTLGVYSRRDYNLKRTWPASWLLPLLGLTRATDYVAFMSNWDVDSGTTAAHWAKAFATNSPVAVRTASLPFIASFGKEIFAWSDDWSFTRESYPAFAVTDTAFYRSDRYHEWSDTVTNLTEHDYEMLAGVVSGLAGMIKAMNMNGETSPKTKWYAGLGWLIGGVGLALVFFFTGCTSVGKPMRTKPGEGVAASDSWYIESKRAQGPRPFSCSFVEFDGRGDYIDFNQHTAAWNKVKELAEAQKILLVFYCHGWKNNSQSGDVVEFNEFLSRLAVSPAVANFGYRVHGIYLGWRGNLYHPYVAKGHPSEDNAYRLTEQLFGGPIVSASRHRRFYWTAWLQEQVSYWSRRNAAEHKVSSVPIARTIFTCASLAKAIDRHEGRKELLASSRVMVMGHSFGALLLERALNATCLDPLTDQWTWFEKHSEGDKEKLQERTIALETQFEINPLPLDFVLFVNSAAPAIYAKTMRDFLSAHQHALQRAHSPAADTPIFVSITSSADKATGFLHPLANVFSPCYPSLQHTYTNLLKIPANHPRSVHQSAFCNRPAGHQPLLVDHWLVESAPSSSDPTNHQGIINANLDYVAENPLAFLAQRSGKDGETKRWTFSLHPPDGRKESERAEKRWAEQFGPLKPSRSSYWLIRCDKRLIRDHNDVWSDSAMQLYAGLYRMVEWTRVPENKARVASVFDHYWSDK